MGKLICENNNEREYNEDCSTQDSTSISKVLESYGSFQILSLAMILPSYTFLGITIFSPVFLYYIPTYNCQQPGLNLTTYNGTALENVYDFSKMDVKCNSIKMRENQSSMDLEYRLTHGIPVFTNTSFETEDCTSGWNYDTSSGDTVVTEFNLVCESAWKRPTMQSVFMIGILVGSLLGGPLSDGFGRRISFSGSFLINTLLTAALSFSTSYVIYIVLLFFLGVFHILVYICGYVLVQELVPHGNKRTMAAMVLNLCFGLGYLLLPLTAYFIRDWRWLYRAVAIGSALYLPAHWFVPESPKWLMQSDNKEKTAKLLERISRLNKVEHDCDDWQDSPKLLKCEAKEKMSKQMRRKSSSPSLLVRNVVLRKRILLVCFMWNVTFLGFYTLTLNSSNLGGDIYLNCLIGAIVDMGSYVFMSFLLKKMGRRNAFALVIALSGLFCLLTPPMKMIRLEAGTASAMTGKFFATTAMSIIIFFTGELFPTLIRNTSVGMASMSARIGSALSPFLIFAGEEINLSIPFYVMGCLSILAASMTFFLPETSKAGLPDTVEDAVRLEQHRVSVVEILTRRRSVQV